MSELFPATMEEQIENHEELELSFENFHTYACINDLVGEQKITVPYSSILNKYRHYLKDTIEEIQLEDDEYYTYRQAPKALSLYLYDTTEYWANLLEINNCKSAMDFDKKIIKAYDPTQLRDMVNEILILEGVLT